MTEQVVDLVPGESKQVSFEAVPSVARTYQVLVNGLTGSFRAIAPAPPAGKLISGIEPFISTVSTTPTNKRVYVHVGPGWNYLLATVTVPWKNTSSAAFGGIIRARLHPYNYGATGFCSSQNLAAIAYQGALVGPGEWGTVIFSIPHAWGGILSAWLYSDGILLDATPEFDPETQEGLYLSQHYAPGGAVYEEDKFRCL